MAAMVVLIAVVFWCGVFAVVFVAKGVRPSELLFGAYEPLPEDLGKWKETGTDEHTGLVREERTLLPERGVDSRYLVHQVRYRDPVARTVTNGGEERRVPRRRRQRKKTQS